MSLALMESTQLVEAFALLTRQWQGPVEELLEREVACLIDYLDEYFGHDNEDFRHLYIGERLKITYRSGASLAERNALMTSLLKNDKRLIGSVLRGLVSVDAIAQVDNFFDEALSLFSGLHSRELRILLIGDCLYLDVMAFLTGLTAADGIALHPHYITYRDMRKVLQELKASKEPQFDLVFFSPFTYDASPIFGQCLAMSSAFDKATTMFDKLAPLLSEVEQVIDHLAATVECPIFIHNTIAVDRSAAAKRALKGVSTHYSRRRVCHLINTWIRTCIAKPRDAQLGNLHCFDERELLREYSWYRLGSTYYKQILQHPAVMGSAVARGYSRICAVVAIYLKKKLVVCDLDNTLWEGVIGEGAVRHYMDRQTMLRSLKEKGVVLAISSKNDPKRVHWDGALLSDKDFVHSEISWEPKVEAFTRIEKRLNLKMKDFIFLDDREDERELVGNRYPQVSALDPGDTEVWARISLWNELLGKMPTIDRTRMYRERAAREALLDSLHIEATPSNRAALYSGLGLRLELSRPKSGDLKRLAELISRTNQFNTLGSRTGSRELDRWSSDSAYHLLQGRVADKFGDMGIVCAIVAQEVDQDIDIAIFVLSCRVFGYGIETAALNHFKRLAIKSAKRVTGRIVNTQFNEPCRNVFAENGFELVDGRWEYSGKDDTSDPDWLAVMSTEQAPIWK
ncbi:MAG: HAD-IIIC family phosphatase [Pseudomonadota bacterium]